MTEKAKQEYWVPFKGCRPLNKRQANTVGFALICGFVAATLTVLAFGKGILSCGLVLTATILAYLLGKKLFGS